VKALAALALVAALGGGCSKKQAIVEVEAMADAICKCKDADCAIKARVEGMAKLVKYKDERGDESDFRQFQAALSRSQICQDKLMTTSPGATPGASATPTSAPTAPPASEHK